MDSTDPLEHDRHMQERDAELARLGARVEQIRDELAQAEAELRAFQLEDMEARRAAITGEPMAPDMTGP